MNTINDMHTKNAYKLIGEVLFKAPICSDSTVDETRWEILNNDLSDTEFDIYHKLKSLNDIVNSMSKGLGDDC